MPRFFGRCAAVVGCAILTALAAGHTAGAQTPKPSPTPVATPVAFTAHAHATVTVATASATFGGSVQFAVAQRTNLTRIDVISVKSDTIPIPPIGVTAVIDRTANTLTVWNDVTKQYRVQPFIPRAATSPTPRPSASPAPPRRRTSPFADLQVLELTMKLTGHTTTLGLPTTGFSYDLQVQRKADKAPLHVTATTQLADEFFIFPMSFDAAVTPGSSPTGAKISYAVDDITRETPPLARFAIPAGYTEAGSLLEVIFQRRSMPSVPMPAPTPTPARTPPPR
ncbi:MAG TPA: hypothetical protein VGU66_00225 [Candidatus Elarobacter sp.]|nr:hypothetical protein [Candidatus Elarobacter sp.]